MSKATNRARTSAHETRNTETRAVQSVHEDEDAPWVRGASLEMPPAKPGMVQRWIAFAINGHPTPSNLMRKRREGWVPVKAEDVPADFPVPTEDHGKFAGCIVVEGSILCERPAAISRRRAKHVAKETKRRTDAINHDLERVNNQNRNPAFGPIQMASESKLVREVTVQSDE